MSTSNLRIECQKNSDGTYNAKSFDGGEELKSYKILSGNCDQIRDLHRSLMEAFNGDPVAVDAIGDECFSKDGL